MRFNSIAAMLTLVSGSDMIGVSSHRAADQTTAWRRHPFGRGIPML